MTSSRLDITSILTVVMLLFSSSSCSTDTRVTPKPAAAETAPPSAPAQTRNEAPPVTQGVTKCRADESDIEYNVKHLQDFTLSNASSMKDQMKTCSTFDPDPVWAQKESKVASNIESYQHPDVQATPQAPVSPQQSSQDESPEIQMGKRLITLEPGKVIEQCGDPFVDRPGQVSYKGVFHKTRLLLYKGPGGYVGVNFVEVFSGRMNLITVKTMAASTISDAGETYSPSNAKELNPVVREDWDNIATALPCLVGTQP
jgi:hypothetical protein